MERISFNVAKALKKQDIFKDLTHLLSGMKQKIVILNEK